MGEKEQVSRREFMRGAATAAAGAAVGAAAVSRVARADVYKSILPQTIIGANEIIRTGHIGVGGMGFRNLSEFVLRRDDMQPIAICDLYPVHLDRAVNEVKKKFDKTPPSAHHDFREIIANKDVDAVIVCTPDHWHAIPSIMACDAKKDVYCEKPLSTTVAEGRHMVDAARRNNTVFQTGTMQRSGAHFQEAVQLVQSGYLGKIGHVDTWIHDQEAVTGIGQGDTKIQEGCDWDFHQGWTKRVPFNSNRWIYNWRWFLDYSGGKVTDWGAHLMDIALWGIGQDKKPKAVCAIGGKYILTDNRTTPDTLNVTWEFDDCTVSFENRVYNGVPRTGHGIMFYGADASMLVTRKGYWVYPMDTKKDPVTGRTQKDYKPVVEKKFELPGPEGEMNQPHWQNFADCIRSRKRPICDPEVLHHTTTVCHLATASYKTGQKLLWDHEKEKFTNSKEANKWIYRPYNNGWKLT